MLSAINQTRPQRLIKQWCLGRSKTVCYPSLPTEVVGERLCPKMLASWTVGIYIFIYFHVAEPGALPGQLEPAPRAAPMSHYLRSGDPEGGVQVGLLEQKARGLLHLGRPDAGVQRCFGDGDICWVSSFSLWSGF